MLAICSTREKSGAIPGSTREAILASVRLEGPGDFFGVGDRDALEEGLAGGLVAAGELVEGREAEVGRRLCVADPGDREVAPVLEREVHPAVGEVADVAPDGQGPLVV